MAVGAGETVGWRSGCVVDSDDGSSVAEVGSVGWLVASGAGRTEGPEVKRSVGCCRRLAVFRFGEGDSDSDSGKADSAPVGIVLDIKVRRNRSRDTPKLKRQPTRRSLLLQCLFSLNPCGLTQEEVTLLSRSIGFLNENRRLGLGSHTASRMLRAPTRLFLSDDSSLILVGSLG